MSEGTVSRYSKHLIKLKARIKELEEENAHLKLVLEARKFEREGENG